MKKIDIYRNIHKKCYSVRSRERGNYGRVIDHTHRAVISAASFVVLQRGREKVRSEKRKNVHAFIRGMMENKVPSLSSLDFIGYVTYNPYENETFVNRETGEEINTAKLVIINKKDIMAFD